MVMQSSIYFMKPAHRILIANRGEIAIRIMRACTKLGVEFVSVCTPEDAGSGHLAVARELGGEEAVCLVTSYLKPDELLRVADATQATAIHPGYGFFAEDWAFAQMVSERSRPLRFIGPSWKLIRELGNKAQSKRLARKLGIPVIPGSDEPVSDDAQAERLAIELLEEQRREGVKQPAVLIKASAGGGGMGIAEVTDMAQFAKACKRVRNFARYLFKDDGLLIERRIRDFNHVEVQLLADKHGHVVHFGTRNCSIQSTGHQKRLEVAPGFYPEQVRYDFDAASVLNAITEDSLKMARETGYDSAGTWEWIVTRDGTPYLMEVNTRIQVENGISAAISRVSGNAADLVEEQIRLGLGEELGYEQEDIRFEGVSLEYRIIAEDPLQNFTPWTGMISQFSWQEEPWLTVHTHVLSPTPEAPYAIPTKFDPNLALAIIWGRDLNEARARGLDFLNHVVITGHNAKGERIKTDLDLLGQKTANILCF